MPAEPEADGRAPGPGTWRRLYLLVLGVLAVEIALLWALARAYR
ncbi:MAG TPA: hypothetical protein VEJ89_05550 [Myxococcaceae bacterium]|jgi:hypothetical protein|nr:hypothetical protein [Myxococcaceae bacterium]